MAATRASGEAGRAGAPEAAPSWRSSRGRPLVGVTADLEDQATGRPRATCAVAYCRAVRAAGGIPLVLPPLPGSAGDLVRRLDAFVLTGGDDPRTEPFGKPTHPAAKPMHPDRQAFEVELIEALAARPRAPVLGVCLGMQMMSLVAGGVLDQHLPDTVATAGAHAGNTRHGIAPCDGSKLLRAGVVASSHHQAVADPGRLRVIARAEDGVIEAVCDPDRPFYLGVQWHPERTDDAALGAGLFERLVQAALRARGRS
ncbi:MAG TPA: gamma-glutamyl-gamma-aminobutyrate hydrolase family protein [Phycisphaerales bacterium]|nr:gamma-glutamyl-gamma-aminobutyrate hydrolase family protein [Phycisphaerales bacterium]